MGFLQEKDKKQIKEMFADLVHPVKIINFTQEFECQYCKETRAILEEVADLSDKIEIEVCNFQIDKEKVEQYGIDKIPATVIEGDQDYGIRFYGIPSGYEFSSLLDAIIQVSKRDSGLADATRDELKKLNQDVHLQVFVTPTCPHCPRAVSLAHRMAIESEYVQGDMVEATEFPHLSQKYSVMGVPRTVINETGFVEGAAPDQMVLEKIFATIS